MAARFSFFGFSFFGFSCLSCSSRTGAGGGGATVVGSSVVSAGASSCASYAARRSGSSSTSAASLNIRNWPAPVPGSNLSVALRQAALISSGLAPRETPSTSYQVGLGVEFISAHLFS